MQVVTTRLVLFLRRGVTEITSDSTGAHATPGLLGEINVGDTWDSPYGSGLCRTGTRLLVMKCMGVGVLSEQA